MDANIIFSRTQLVVPAPAGDATITLGLVPMHTQIYDQTTFIYRTRPHYQELKRLSQTFPCVRIDRFDWSNNRCGYLLVGRPVEEKANLCLANDFSDALLSLNRDACQRPVFVGLREIKDGSFVTPSLDRFAALVLGIGTFLTTDDSVSGALHVPAVLIKTPEFYQQAIGALLARLPKLISERRALPTDILSSATNSLAV